MSMCSLICALPSCPVAYWHHCVVRLQPEHELQNADELMTLLLRHPQGMFVGQFKDAYKGILDDVKARLPSLLPIYLLHCKQFATISVVCQQVATA